MKDVNQKDDIYQAESIDNKGKITHAKLEGKSLSLQFYDNGWTLINKNYMFYENLINAGIHFINVKSIDNKDLTIYIDSGSEIKIYAHCGDQKLQMISKEHPFCINRWISGIPLAFLTVENKILLIENKYDGGGVFRSPWMSTLANFSSEDDFKYHLIEIHHSALYLKFPNQHALNYYLH